MNNIFFIIKEKIKEILISKKIKNIYNFCIAINYSKQRFNKLAILCEKYGSDKGFCSAKKKDRKNLHSYADYYELLFGKNRYAIKNVFECGIGSINPSIPCSMNKNFKPGASLRVWKEYFPKARIIGADIDKQILFKESRIKTFFMDQTNPESIKNVWIKNKSIFFDLMIDDGLHTFTAGICLFKNSISRLKTGGIYFIEDVALHDIKKYLSFFKASKYRVEIINFFQPGVCLTDNNLIKISH